jgi:hypothetical protein
MIEWSIEFSSPEGGFYLTKLRSPEAQERAYEQAVRQRWRALVLWVKAVLEAAESGITTLEEALLSFILLPDNRTVGEWMEKQLEQVYLEGKMPPLIPYLKDHTP